MKTAGALLSLPLWLFYMQVAACGAAEALFLRNPILDAQTDTHPRTVYMSKQVSSSKPGALNPLTFKS